MFARCANTPTGNFAAPPPCKGPFPYYHTFTVDIDEMIPGSPVFKYGYRYRLHLFAVLLREHQQHLTLLQPLITQLESRCNLLITPSGNLSYDANFDHST